MNTILTNVLIVEVNDYTGVPRPLKSTFTTPNSVQYNLYSSLFLVLVIHLLHSSFKISSNLERLFFQSFLNDSDKSPLNNNLSYLFIVKAESARLKIINKSSPIAYKK